MPTGTRSGAAISSDLVPAVSASGVDLEKSSGFLTSLPIDAEGVSVTERCSFC